MSGDSRRGIPFWVDPEERIVDVEAKAEPMVQLAIRPVKGGGGCCERAMLLAYQESGEAFEPGDWFRCRFCGKRVEITNTTEVFP